MTQFKDARIVNSSASSQPNALPEEPTPSLAVLARIPRIDGATPPPAAVGDSSPVLVVVDDEPAEPTIDGPQLAAIDALVESAAKSQPSPAQEPPRPIKAEQAPPSSTFAGRLFRVHELLAPYSSVIVTIALLVAAGLLYVVASQPAIDASSFEPKWAEVESPQPPVATGQPARNSAPAAQNLAATIAASSPPTTAPDIPPTPVSPYQSTGMGYDQAWIPDESVTR